MNRLDDAAFREATAFEPQSTVGDLINHAFFQLDELLNGIGYPLLQAHDEIVCEVEAGDDGFAAELMRRYFEWPLVFEGVGEVRIPAEVAVGRSWGELERWEG